MPLLGISRLTGYIRSYPFLLIFALGCLWGVSSLFFPVEHQREILAPRGEGDRAYFGGGTVISQEFIAHRGISGIDIPLGSDRYPNTPLILHLRTALNSEDIAAVPLFSFSHNEVARFRFSPLWNVAGKILWVLEAPHAPEKSFWGYHEQDDSAFSEGKAYQNKRSIKGNLAFFEIWEYPRIATLTIDEQSLIKNLSSWERSSVILGIIGALAVLLFRRVPLSERSIIILSSILGFALHIWLGLYTPIIIDEGSYIQDVLQSSSSLLPFRDFLTKGPLYLFFLWLWSFIVPNAVLFWRLFSAIAWGLGGWWFWRILVESDIRPRSRIFASLLFILLPAAVSLTTPLLLQTASVSVSLLGILLVIRAVKTGRWHLAAWASFVFTVAFFMRVTAVLPALIAFLYILLFAKKGLKRRLLIPYILIGVFLCSAIFAVTAATIGIEKAAVTVNMEAFLISQNRQGRSETMQAGEPLLRTLTIESRLLWRSGIILLAPLFILPTLFIRRNRYLVATVLLVMLFAVCRSVLNTLVDTDFLLPKAAVFAELLILAISFIFPFITAMAVLLYGMKGFSTSWRVVGITVLWLVISVAAYSKWGRFRQSYLTEFVPQLAILAGIAFDGMYIVWRKIQPTWLSKFLIGLSIFLIAASISQGYSMARLYPHSGTIDQGSLVRIVELIHRYVPREEQIFTAQPVATALSGRGIVFGYSHPGWYREARFGTISESLRDLLFITPDAMTEYLATTVRFVLMDSRTDEIYFDGYPERREILKNMFEAVGAVYNEEAGDTYTLYRRR